MRGTQNVSLRCCSTSGIIPAYAGNTTILTTLRTFSWDHPRVCGEHLRSSTRAHIRQGSSPRMRGTLTPCCRNFVRWGDHPRVCGEHRYWRVSIGRNTGSSPRMRGTHEIRRFWYLQGGIIPAYAGNTHGLRERCRSSRDHPRVCGEHLREIGASTIEQGSSPRMRGTHRPRRTRHRQPRIIPAYAGNTWLLRCR